MISTRMIAIGLLVVIVVGFIAREEFKKRLTL